MKEKKKKCTMKNKPKYCKSDCVNVGPHRKKQIDKTDFQGPLIIFRPNGGFSISFTPGGSAEDSVGVDYCVLLCV